MSDLITKYILEQLEDDKSSDPSATIKRNELAEMLGCVPSQINYVITSRFTPEQGYIVESRRGGGGYIKITRISMDKHTAIVHLLSAIGDSIDARTAAELIKEMLTRGMIDLQTAKLLNAAVSERPYLTVNAEYRDRLRAAVLKNMLIAL